jgi:hypothetical protein
MFLYLLLCVVIYKKVTFHNISRTTFTKQQSISWELLHVLKGQSPEIDYFEKDNKFKSALLNLGGGGG